MFINALETFRAKTNDVILYIDDDADSDKSYEACCDFLDEYSYDDNKEICALNDYITYGEFGEGRVNKRLVDILASLCTQYIKTSTAVIGERVRYSIFNFTPLNYPYKSIANSQNSS